MGYGEVVSDLSDSEIYDWIVDIDLITNVFKNGWNVNFSKQFLKNSSLNIQKHVIGDRGANNNNNNINNIDEKIPESRNSEKNIISDENLETKTLNWKGAIVAVVGIIFCDLNFIFF